MTTIRDRIWMYAAEREAYNDVYKLPALSPYEPEDVCRNLGIRRVVMDVTKNGPFYPFDACSRRFSDMDELVWTIVPSGGVERNNDGFFDTEEVIRQIQRFPNVTGVFVDDFNYARRALCTPEKLAEMRQKVVAAGAGRKIDVWMVTYNHDIAIGWTAGKPIWFWGDSVDVASFWTWQSYYLRVLPEHLEFIAGRWPGKRINLGVYLWDFSRSCPMSDDFMNLQLDTTLKYFRMGLLDSISLCSNCLFGIGIPSADIFLRWLDKYGDEEVETRNVTFAETLNNRQL